MMHKARASVVDVSRWLSDDTSVPHLFLAIELVGTRSQCFIIMNFKHALIEGYFYDYRFLRKMVRILAATAIRGALVAGIEASRSLLVDIALSGDRLQASAPLPGEALCMCGVGYDLQSNSKEANAANRGGAAPPTKGEANPKGIRSQRKDRKKRRRHDITEEDSEERSSAPGIHHIKTLACDT